MSSILLLNCLSKTTSSGLDFEATQSLCDSEQAILFGEDDVSAEFVRITTDDNSLITLIEAKQILDREGSTRPDCDQWHPLPEWRSYKDDYAYTILEHQGQQVGPLLEAKLGEQLTFKTLQ